MKESDSAIVAVRDDFFARRSWQRKQCPLCLEEYYTKRDLPHCGSYRCAGGYPFLNIPAPKVYLELGACAENFREFFTTRGYRLHPPVAIVRSDERTLFASTAGQVFDDLIYGQSPQRDPQQCAVMQPVIRLQGIGLVASLDGISTSFVHTATECWNATTEKHFNSLDQWLDFFSGLGLHVGGLCLKLKCADNDWAGRTVTSEMLKINYDGLEVGVANLFFNIILHFGTLLVLLLFFWNDIMKISRKYILYIITGSIITGAIGFIFYDILKSFFESLFVVSLGLIFTSIILFSTKRYNGKSKLNLIDSIFIGLAQGIAIIPGVSRSGMTISTGLFRNVNKEEVFKFSFLLSMPAIFGALIYEGSKAGFSFNVNYLIGFIASIIIGYLSLNFFKDVVKKRKLHYFGYYCLIVGIIMLIISI